MNEDGTGRGLFGLLMGALSMRGPDTSAEGAPVSSTSTAGEPDDDRYDEIETDASRWQSRLWIKRSNGTKESFATKTVAARSIARYAYMPDENAEFYLVVEKLRGARRETKTRSTTLSSHRLLAEYLVRSWLNRARHPQMVRFFDRVVPGAVFVIKQHELVYQPTIKFWGYPTDTRRLDTTLAMFIAAVSEDGSEAGLPRRINHKNGRACSALMACIDTVQQDLGDRRAAPYELSDYSLTIWRIEEAERCSDSE